VSSANPFSTGNEEAEEIDLFDLKAHLKASFSSMNHHSNIWQILSLQSDVRTVQFER